FFSTVYGTNLKLHSFPTRRSSDLRRKLAGSHRSERSSQCARSKVRRSLQSIGTYLAELNFYEIAAPTKRPSYRPSDPRLFQPATVATRAPITANTPSQDGITIRRSIQWFMFSPLESTQIPHFQATVHTIYGGYSHYLALNLLEQAPADRRASRILHVSQLASFGSDPEPDRRSLTR